MYRTNKHEMQRPKRRMRRFIVYALVLILAGASSAAILISHNREVDAQVAQIEADQKAFIDDVDAQLRAIAERKERERQEAAANAIADQSTQSSTEVAATINAADCNIDTAHNNPASVDVVVNKKHCIQPLLFAPDDLVEVYGAVISAKASDAFTALYNAAATAGQPIRVTSSYRSYSTQVNTYNYWVSVSGTVGADTYSARPGYSEHQTGLAVDIAAGGCALDCFGSTSQYQWMLANAANYGFIQRYYAGSEAITGYSAEEWHYRYVGEAVAKDMKAKGIKTLEEYWNISGGEYYY